MSRNSSPPPKRPSRSKGKPAEDFVSLLEQGVERAVGAPNAVVLAVSGGADSIAMLHGWLESKTLTRTLVVAHFDHRLRPDSSNDAEWVRCVSESLGVDCKVGVWEDPKKGENAARLARQQFLLDVARKSGAVVATAHTRDDQAETVLFRILRGTGVDGLTGIPEWRRIEGQTGFLRPLLRVARSVGRRYLVDRGLDWREDASNAGMEFARNRLRNELIPLLEKGYNRRVVDALIQLADNASEHRLLTDLRIDQLWEPIAFRWSHRSEEASISRDAFERMYPMEFKLVLRTLFREKHWPMGRMNADHWNRLASLNDQGGPTHWEGPDQMSATMTSTEFIIRRKR